jgi:hypothetical protein
MADYVPHPLVTRVGMHVFETKAKPGTHEKTALTALVTASNQAASVAQTSAKAAEKALAAAAARVPPAPPAPPVPPAPGAKPAAPPAPPAAVGGSAAPIDPIGDDDAYPRQKRRLAAALSERADVPELSLFAGFLAGHVEGPQGDSQLVYLDARLYSWLVVKETDIVVHERMTDAGAPYGVRDVLWVRRDATLIQGTGSRSNAGRFLVGELTAAGDFAASTTGGTFSAATGLLCEATTPGCCYSSRTGH